jgi:hypothetical protein
MLVSELGLSPQARGDRLGDMRANANSLIAERPFRPHAYSLHAADGGLYELSMFLAAQSDVLEAALAQGLAVVLVCWLY